MDDTEQRADGDVGLVTAFVNTAEPEEGTDEFSSAEGALRWLREWSFEIEEPMTESQRLRLVEAREALRDLIAAGRDATIRSGPLAVLNAAGRAARLTLRFEDGGVVALEPEAANIDQALGKILAAAYAAMLDGSWTRLKICQNEECRWAFYDSSRNRSGKWCSMQACGNRMKARAFRARHGSEP